MIFGPAVTSVFLGISSFIIGYLAQRSRMCFVAGLRDYILVRDKELLTGVFAFFCTVWFLTSILFAAGILERGTPEYSAAASIREAGRVEKKPPVPGLQKGSFIEGLRNTEGKKYSIFNRFLAVTVIGGGLLGFLSVLAGGCVLRQHVLCAQGQRNSLYFLLGFYAAAVIFYTLLFRFFDWVYS